MRLLPFLHAGVAAVGQPARLCSHPQVGTSRVYQAVRTGTAADLAAQLRRHGSTGWAGGRAQVLLGRFRCCLMYDVCMRVWQSGQETALFLLLFSLLSASAHALLYVPNVLVSTQWLLIVCAYIFVHTLCSTALALLFQECPSPLLLLQKAWRACKPDDVDCCRC